jgi:hypothetical protein
MFQSNSQRRQIERLAIKQQRSIATYRHHDLGGRVLVVGIIRGRLSNERRQPPRRERCDHHENNDQHQEDIDQGVMLISALFRPPALIVVATANLLGRLDTQRRRKVPGHCNRGTTIGVVAKPMPVASDIVS